MAWNPDIAVARLAREADHRDARVPGFEFGCDLAGGSDGVFLKGFALKAPSPAVKDFDDFGARLNLLIEIFDGAFGQKVDDLLKKLIVAFAQRMGRALIFGPATCNHIGRHSPGGPGKADQRRFAGQLARQDAHGFIDRRKLVMDVVLALEFGKIGVCGDGR